MINHTDGICKINGEQSRWMAEQSSVKHLRIDTYKGCLAMVPMWPSTFEGEANARRLVAAWNACQGIETEDLEGARLDLLKTELDASHELIGDLRKRGDEAERLLRELADDYQSLLRECSDDNDDGDRPRLQVIRAFLKAGEK